MLKKRYIYDTDFCKLHEFFSDVVVIMNRLNVVGFSQQDYVAYYQPLYDGQYSLIIAILPPFYRLFQSNNYLVSYITFTFSNHKEMMEFIRYMFMPVVFSFYNVYKSKRKILITKRLILKYKKFVDYAVTAIE